MHVIVFITAFMLQAATVDLYKQGHALLDAGNIKKAEIVLKKSAAQNPSHIPTLKDLARIYTKQKHFDEAIEVYKKIVRLNPGDMTARGHLAELYAWNGDYDRSIVTYREALELAPDNAALKTGLARVYRWSHRYEEAKGLYKEVLKSDPEHHEALKGLASTYSISGELPPAVELLRKAAGLYPEDAEIYKQLGTVLAWQKDYRRAIGYLEKAIKLRPDYTAAYSTTGDVYSWMGQNKKAIEFYRKAVELAPEDVDNYLQLASLYIKVKDPAKAQETVSAALRLDPTNRQAIEMLRRLREKGGTGLGLTVGKFVEDAAVILVFIVIFFNYRNKSRILLRRHRLYFYFTNFILPVLVLITFGSFLAQGYLSSWVSAELVEDVTEAVLFFALGSSFLALLWVERRSHDISRMVILAVGAHPDDIELGCGGFLMKAKDGGARVYALTMTKGEKGTRKNGRREEEFRRAARYMGTDECWILDLPDTGLKEKIPEMKDIIEEKIKEVGANVILTHTPLDAHSDHKAVFEASMEAGRAISVFVYEDVGTDSKFVPNYYVDITDYIEDKLSLVGFHRTQGSKTYMDPEVIKGRAAHRGLQCGVQYAEAFGIQKLLL